jgi:AcrR family transcriptional regulator
MIRKSKADWLNTALELLENQGVQSITIVNLAKVLGVSRSGFYWHFKDREDLLKQLLHYWTHEFTAVITSNPEIITLEPVKRLRHIAYTVFEYDLTKYEITFQNWGKMDPKIAKEVFRVYKLRIDLIRKTYSELGFEGDDLDMRTNLFIGFLNWELTIFKNISKRKMRKLTDLRIQFLTKK